MRTERTTPLLPPVTPFERHLMHKYRLRDRWVRTFNELRGEHR